MTIVNSLGEGIWMRGAAPDEEKPEAPVSPPSTPNQEALDAIQKEIFSLKEENKTLNQKVEGLTTEKEKLLNHRDTLMDDLKKKGKDTPGSSADIVRQLEEMREQVRSKDKLMEEAIAAKDKQYKIEMEKMRAAQEKQDRQLAEMRVMTPFQRELQKYTHAPDDAISVTGITSQKLENIGGEIYIRGDKTEKEPDGALLTVKQWAQASLKPYMLKSEEDAFASTGFRPDTRPLGSGEMSLPEIPTTTNNPFIRQEGQWDPWAQEQLVKQNPAKAKVLQAQARKLNASKAAA